LVRPEQELKAFAKLDLEAGAADTLTFALDRTALAFYDPARPGWVAEPGEFELRIGASSRDIRLQQTIEVHP
jgi:beta-glucosidase